MRTGKNKLNKTPLQYIGDTDKQCVKPLEQKSSPQDFILEEV